MTINNDSPILLTPAEAANMLHVTAQTLAVWRATKRYPLNYVKVGGRVCYKLSDIEDFITSRIVTVLGK